MAVRVTFLMTPDSPDDDDKTGMSNEEFEQVTDHLMMELGAENIEIVKVDE